MRPAMLAMHLGCHYLITRHSYLCIITYVLLLDYLFIIAFTFSGLLFWELIKKNCKKITENPCHATFSEVLRRRDGRPFLAVLPRGGRLELSMLQCRHRWRCGGDARELFLACDGRIH